MKRLLTLLLAVLCLSTVACNTAEEPLDVMPTEEPLIDSPTERPFDAPPTEEPLPAPEKPILYFYPEEDTIVSAKLELNGQLTCTYPEHGTDGWENYLAKPDGTLISQDGGEYYALYWEGEIDAPMDFTKGFCVEGSRTADFLAEILPCLGLNAREANEFIIYWLPQMQGSAYNLISFQTDAYTDNAKLILSPEPDTLIRVFMAWKPLEKPIGIEPQTIVTPERIGFTVVEWGGCKVG